MSYEGYPIKQRVTHVHISDNYDINGFLVRNKIHIMLIALCALLLIGDFMTTSVALALANSGESGTTMSIAEGNPFMSPIVGTPVLFLLVKALILAVIVASAYLLRNEGAMAYLPCILVCSFYLWVNFNNINVLASVIM
jgi:hypothetical protein